MACLFILALLGALSELFDCLLPRKGRNRAKNAPVRAQRDEPSTTKSEGLAQSKSFCFHYELEIESSRSEALSPKMATTGISSISKAPSKRAAPDSFLKQSWCQ